ncbi:hypothetical protein BT69DRAFT_1287090, partial [Atractiella rhizophila]
MKASIILACALASSVVAVPARPWSSSPPKGKESDSGKHKELFVTMGKKQIKRQTPPTTPSTPVTTSFDPTNAGYLQGYLSGLVQAGTLTPDMIAGIVNSRSTGGIPTEIITQLATVNPSIAGTLALLSQATTDGTTAKELDNWVTAQRAFANVALQQAELIQAQNASSFSNTTSTDSQPGSAAQNGTISGSSFLDSTDSGDGGAGGASDESAGDPEDPQDTDASSTTESPSSSDDASASPSSSEGAESTPKGDDWNEDPWLMSGGGANNLAANPNQAAAPQTSPSFPLPRVLSTMGCGILPPLPPLQMPRLPFENSKMEIISSRIRLFLH